MKGLWLKLAVLGLVSLTILGNLVTGSAQESGDELQITGIFNVHTTNPDRMTSFSVYETETGNRYDLRGVTEYLGEFGGYDGLIGRNVLVTGTLSAEGDAIDVTGIDLAEFGIASHIDLIDDRHWEGMQHYVNVLCRFGDSTDVTPQDPSYFQTTLLPELNEFWDELSYGQAELETTTEGWFNLDNPRSDYLRDNGELRFEQVRDDCLAVAEDEGVSFPDYDGINMMFNENLDGDSYGDVVSLDLNDEVNTYGLTWLANEHWEIGGDDTSGRSSLHVTLHEFGHSLGLPHSCEVPTAVYGSRWDVMSSGVRTHTIAMHKDKLGWIEDDYKYVPTDAENQLIFLERLALPDLPLAEDEYLMVDIPIPGSDTRFYTAEMRMRVGQYDTNIPAGRGVVLHEVDLLREHPVYGEGFVDCQASLVDARGVGSGFSDNDAGMRPGFDQVYEFPTDDVDLSVAPLQETDTGTWVMFNPDLEMSIEVPDEAVAGEDVEAVVSLTANGEPASFAEGWEALVNFPVFQNITFDENGEARFTFNSRNASETTVVVDFAYLREQTTIDILPGDPASLDLTADPESQTAGESVELTVSDVEDEFGNTVAEGTEITFDISGSSDEEPTRTDGGSGWTVPTDANGSATLSYRRLFPSDDVVVASAGDEPSVASDPVDVTWQLPESEPGLRLRAQTQRPDDIRLHVTVNSLHHRLAGVVVYAERSTRFATTDLLSATGDDDHAIVYARVNSRRGDEKIVRIDLWRDDPSGPTARVRWVDHDTGEFSMGRVSIR